MKGIKVGKERVLQVEWGGHGLLRVTLHLCSSHIRVVLSALPSAERCVWSGMVELRVCRNYRRGDVLPLVKKHWLHYPVYHLVHIHLSSIKIAKQ